MKKSLFQAICILIVLVSAIIIWVNLSLRQKPVAVWQKYDHLRVIKAGILSDDYIDWEDHFDTTFVDSNGCIVVTNK